MGIKELIQWHKHEDAPKAITSEARYEINRCLGKRGLDGADFLAKVRQFFEDSQVHYVRLAFRDAIAASLGLDMEQKENQRRVWEIMAERRVIGRTTADRWERGESDPDTDKIMLFFNSLGQASSWPRLSNKESMQMGIARTLTYILVFPPGKVKQDFDPGPLRDELKPCWEMLKRHDHYWGKQRRDLNQDALDQVRYNFRDSLWIGAHDIGAIKRRIEDAPLRADPLYLPFAIFQYVTFVDSPASHKRKDNPDKWIWHPGGPRHAELWGL